LYAKINFNSNCALLFLTPNFVFSVGIPTVMGWAQAQDEQAAQVLEIEPHPTAVVDQGSLTEREAVPV